MRSLISVRDLDRGQVEEILDLSKAASEGKLSKRSGSVALLFLEPSTRTRVSFERACREMGLETFSVLGDTSSMTKGESLFDTLKTFEGLGFDLVVFRLPFVLFPYDSLLKELDLALVNAGDGTHQHPTQGLIDLFTLTEKLGSLKGVKVLYVGDVSHSRVFRSGAPLLKMFGAAVSVCGPRTLIPRDVDVFGVEKIFDDVDEGIEWADVVVWLRLQRERQREGLVPSEGSYFKQFGLTRERHDRLRGYFMHPGPVNRGVDIEDSLVYSEKSLIQQQVKNGLFVRMGVLSWCLS